MIIELTPQERHDQEAALPPIFKGSVYSPARIEWYTRFVVESGLVRGGAAVIPELIAAMIAESALNNRALGDANPDIHFGVGWMQLDTGFHVPSLEALLAIRLDPLYTLTYVTTPSNGLITLGAAATHFKKSRWNAWKPEIIDPVSGWSPLQAALTAWEVVT